MTEKISSKQFFRILAVIHGTLVAGALLFLLTVSFMLSEEELTTTYFPEWNLFYLIVGVFALWAIFGSEFIYRLLLKRIQRDQPLSKIMFAYQSANIIRFAIVEGVALLAIVFTLLTSSIWFMVVAGLMLILLFYMRPNPERAVKDLQLTGDQARKVLTPEAFIAESHPSK